MSHLGLYDVPVGFVTPPPPILMLNIAYFAVAEGWLLLDIGWFVLFLHNYDLSLNLMTPQNSWIETAVLQNPVFEAYPKRNNRFNKSDIWHNYYRSRKLFLL